MKKNIFILLSLLLYNLICAQYTTQGTTLATGTKYSLDILSNISSGVVVKESPTLYSIKQDLKISAYDSLIVNNNVIVKIDPNITVTIAGYFETNSTSSEFTSSNIYQRYKGFLFSNRSKILLNNSRFSYGGGIKCLTKKVMINNCEFYKNTKGINDNSILNVTTILDEITDIPVIKNSRFLENSATAFEGSTRYLALHFLNNYVYKNINVGYSQVIISGTVGMTQFGINDSLRVKNNQIIGDRNVIGTGGIRVITQAIPLSFSNNFVKDNSYGLSVDDSNYNFVLTTNKYYDNTIEDNNVDVNASSSLYAGSGIYILADAHYVSNYLTRNIFRNNQIGVYLKGGGEASLGDDNLANYNPGHNIFYNNIKNGQLNAIYVGDVATVIPKAKFNCWREGELSSYNMVMETVHTSPITSGSFTWEHTVPFLCGDGLPLSTIEENILKKIDNKIYPIPNNGSFYISANENDDIIILDTSGKIVFEAPINKGTENKIQTNLTKGLYLVKFKNTQQVVKIIIK